MPSSPYRHWPHDSLSALLTLGATWQVHRLRLRCRATRRVHALREARSSRQHDAARRATGRPPAGASSPHFSPHLPTSTLQWPSQAFSHAPALHQALSEYLARLPPTSGDVARAAAAVERARMQRRPSDGSRAPIEAALKHSAGVRSAYRSHSMAFASLLKPSQACSHAPRPE